MSTWERSWWVRGDLAHAERPPGTGVAAHSGLDSRHRLSLVCSHLKPATMGKKKRPTQKLAVAAMPRRPPRLPSVSLGVIFVVALAIRVHPVVDSPETFRGGRGMFGDTYLYNAIAYNLYKGNGFSGTDYGGSVGRGENKPGLTYEPSIVRAPLYPFFLAGVYKVFSSHEDVPSPSTWRKNFDRVRLTQCVLDAFV